MQNRFDIGPLKLLNFKAFKGFSIHLPHGYRVNVALWPPRKDH